MSGQFYYFYFSSILHVSYIQVDSGLTMGVFILGVGYSCVQIHRGPNHEFYGYG